MIKELKKKKERCSVIIKNKKDEKYFERETDLNDWNSREEGSDGVFRREKNFCKGETDVTE